MSADAPASPCVAVCVLDPVSGLCRGCHRSIAEITAWPRLGPDEKRRVLAALPVRLANPRASPT